MSCYICLEDSTFQIKGCECKGSISVHETCLQEWLHNTENPFQCTVCKADYRGTFLNRFLSTETILFYPTEELEEETILHNFHGIPIVETSADLLFISEEHRSIYRQTIQKERQSRRLESLQKRPIRNTKRSVRRF